MSSFSGFILVIIAGFCWIGIGVSVSVCSARKWNYSLVQGLSYLGSTLLCAVLLAVQGKVTSFSEVASFGLLMSFLAGFSNFFTYVFAAKAMQRGPNGLVWGMMQAGMIGSFLMGVIFFDEKATLLRLAGLILILSGVLLMGMTKNSGKSSAENSSNGAGWVLLSCCALLLVMVTHCCNALPSYFPNASGGNSIIRTMGMYLGGVAGFLIMTVPGMIRKREAGGRGEWVTAIILMLVNTSASVFFLYRGLDILAKNGSGGLGYPVAIGVCVTGFSLYSLFVLKEKFARLSLLGLISVCLGIIIISLR